MKRILIDIGHPAHVHNYKNLAKELEHRGHRIYWTVKDITIAKYLLDIYGFSYIVLPKKSDSLLGKGIKQLYYDIALLILSKRQKIDIAIGTSVAVAHISRITKISSIVFDDDDDGVQPLFAKFVIPFADSVLSPDSLEGKRSRSDTVYYPGYHELAYLHPNRFTPDPSVLEELGLGKDDKYFLMRFNVFKAHHDIGEKGISIEQKLELVRILEPHGRVFITTEREIEKELQKYQLKISPEKIHSIMAYCTLFLGDSQTMTSEAAVLGIPSLRCNSFSGRISYLEDLEQEYQLTFSYLPEDFTQLVTKLNELLKIKNLEAQFQKRRKRMLEEKIDVTSFWVWFIGTYPKSIRDIKCNTDILQSFK